MPGVNELFNSSHLITDQAKKSYAGMLTRLMPGGAAPMFLLSSMLGNSKTAMQFEHGFYTKTAIFPSFDLTADILAGTTVFTVADTSELVPGQVHRLEETGENVIINSVDSPTQITVGRAVGTVAAAAITVASDISEAYQVGNAFEEASVRPVALSVSPDRMTNLTQTFRDTWVVSGSAAAIQNIAGSGDGNVAENRRDCAMFHAMAIEKAILFGQKSQGTRNGQPFRTMDGFHNIVSNLAYYPSTFAVPNVYAAAATTNYDQLEGFLDPVFDQVTDPSGPNQRVLFVGSQARKVINGIGRLHGQYEIVDGQTSFGLQFDTIKISRGTFRMIEHPLFNSNVHWKSMAMAVDLSTFSLAYLGNRKTRNQEFNANGDTMPTDNGIDAVGGTLTSELTVEIRNPPANAIITGLTAAA